MKKSRFSDSQIFAVLKQAEAGAPVPDLCRQHGICSATFYKWRSKFGCVAGSKAGSAPAMRLAETARGLLRIFLIDGLR